MNFFVQNEDALMFIISLLIIFKVIFFMFYIRCGRESKYFFMIVIITIIYFSLGIFTKYNSNKFINLKTKELLEIASTEEIEEILKDVPTNFMNRIHNELRKERLRNSPSAEIEEILNKIYYEQSRVPLFNNYKPKSKKEDKSK